MKSMNKYIIKRDYDKYKNSFKNQMLLNASYFGNICMLRQWGILGGNVDYSEERDGWCAIHYACRWENIPMLKYLIESKANMKKTTSDKETVFHISALWDRVKSAQFLIDQGFYEEPYLKNTKGFTAFELAVSKEMKTILSYK